MSSTRSAEHVRFEVGARFIFDGLTGQQGHAQRLPGSGSVGMLVEVLGVSPWGSLSVRCGPDVEKQSMSDTFTISIGDAVEMVRQGCWRPVD